jgi:hypothetical protein
MTLARLLAARLGAFLALVLLVACAPPEPRVEPPPPELGNFSLGFNIVVGSTAQAVGPSRQATAEEWEQVLKTEIDRRLGGYQGDRDYHVAISVDAYALAVPGIPLVVSPKSVLAISVTLWDAEAGGKWNAEPHRITVFESLSGNTFVGSGLTQSKEEQMGNLSRNAVREILKWLEENRAWFEPDATLPARFVPRAGSDAAAADAAAPAVGPLAGAGTPLPPGVVAPGASVPAN